MRKLNVLLVFFLAGLVFIAGCTGGGTKTSETSTQTQSTTQSETPTQTTTSSPTQTTPSTSSPTQTTTTTTTTETQTQVTTTQTPVEEAYWRPWEYAPFELNGELYIITYYKYYYKVKPNQTAPLYEYEIEKKIGKEKIHLYGQDIQMNKKDLGEFEVWAYQTVVTPIKAENLEKKLMITVWYKSNQTTAAIYPWDVAWFGLISPYGGDEQFVGMRIEYSGETFELYNPMPFQSGLFPYFEGDDSILSNIGNDLSYLYIGWLATINFGLWYAWEDYNLLVPQSGTWSDGLHTWTWETKPDGSVTLGGLSFKVVDAKWSYAGAEGVSLSGKSRFSPYLPLVIEGEGTYGYKDPQTNEEFYIYAYLKLEDLGVEQVS